MFDEKLKKIVVIKIPVIIEIILNIWIIFVFFKPEYLNTSISLLLNSFIKNNCVEIKNMNGNISKIMSGEFNKDKYNGKYISTLISFKKI